MKQVTHYPYFLLLQICLNFHCFFSFENLIQRTVNHLFTIRSGGKNTLSKTTTMKLTFTNNLFAHFSFLFFVQLRVFCLTSPLHTIQPSFTRTDSSSGKISPCRQVDCKGRMKLFHFMIHTVQLNVEEENRIVQG